MPLDDEFQADGQILPMEVADWAPNPEQRYRTAELREILIKALRELRPALRTVFVLRDIEGLSTAETADALNLSHAAVKARLCRGRLQLRERLNMYFREEWNQGGWSWTLDATMALHIFVAAVSSSVFANCI